MGRRKFQREKVLFLSNLLVYKSWKFSAYHQFAKQPRRCIPPFKNRHQISLLCQMRKPKRQENIACVVLAQGSLIAFQEYIPKNT